MRGVYRFFAGLIALEVLIQAAAVAYGIFRLGKWVDDGATLDKATFESDSTSFQGLGGLMLHGMNGMMIIPVIGLIFFIVSFFAKVERGILLAGLTLVAIVVQVFLGLFAHSAPILGILHAPNAFVIFGLAVTAMLKARHKVPVPPVPPGPTAAEGATTTSV